VNGDGVGVQAERAFELRRGAVGRGATAASNGRGKVRDGQPCLSGILDFESAWASTGESDLARLELWWLTRGSAVREGYAQVTQVAAGYLSRRPVLQLPWCLEYADFHPTP
jgi:hypothetical protein